VAAAATLAEPIVAVATAPGRGAVGIVRLSGPSLHMLVQQLCGQTLAPRHATYLPLRDEAGELIDHGLALYFPAPHSYTGEDVLELQVHGGPMVLQVLLARCLQAGVAAGLRLARPGEFTERAFLNGKLDLAQAEAVADLIDATTQAAARSAGRSLQGVFSQRVNALAKQALELRALVEATLDFPEEDIDFLEAAQAHQRLAALAVKLEEVLAQSRQGALLREGLRVVLAGQPNVGKSSLLNALAGAELAIVTPQAGTTRDRIGETLEIEGVPIHITDTAGLRAPHEAQDEVERIGIARSWEAIAQADVVLLLHDVSRMGEAGYEAAQAQVAAELMQALPEGPAPVHLLNKVDLAPAPSQASGLRLSARTGEGLAALRQLLLERGGWQAQTEGVFLARTRHVAALREALTHVQAAQARAREQALELMAEELRLAHASLGRITGQVDVEDLLGEIFSRFCIGK
jgi:tRNA modification GTPase